MIGIMEKEGKNKPGNLNKLPVRKRVFDCCFLTCMCFFLFITQYNFSQADTTGMIRYTPEFEFTDGIYLSFEQVRQNNPILKSRLITNVDYTSKDFFEQVLDNRFVYFFDHVGMKQQVRTSDIWGFSRNGVLYIAMDEGFYRITIIGRICHFVATVTTYDSRYYDPYYYNPYYYNNYYRYGGYPATYSSNELRQYLLDFDSGEIMDYNRDNLEILLMKDPELHDEYSQLRRKKKKQLKFLYLRKFNERNPLYLPVPEI
ncbi:MAG: hypothetical protein AMS27_05115 [Bacteroides sp. SM23_62_1]|nr:MAG: hypothetical protein AMS27_05115 [Bacteroides sp. SM23_62_1]